MINASLEVGYIPMINICPNNCWWYFGAGIVTTIAVLIAFIVIMSLISCRRLE